jgi:sugar diacid utilization regulator
MQLVRYAADIFGDLLNLSLNKNLEKYEKYSFLVDLLDEKDVPEAAIRNLYFQLDWEEASSLVLYKVSTPPSVYDGALFDWIYDSIAAKAVNEIVFKYNQAIVVITRKNEGKANTVISHLQALFSYANYHCGISYEFTGLNNIASHYFQAGRAIELTRNRGSKFHYFRDCAFDGLVCAVKAGINWRDYVTPSLLSLIDTDASQGTEYYRTLYCLLVNKGHSSNAAAALFIHRNTLKYRLDKITQILDMDVFDENVSSYLRFCYALLREDYPVVMPLPSV